MGTWHPTAVHQLLWFEQAGNRRQDQGIRNTASHVLVFTVSPPAMGYSTFSAKATGNEEIGATLATPTSIRTVPQSAAPFSVDNGIYELTFDPSTGLMTTITNMKSKLTTSLEVSWGWYNSSVGGCTPGGLGCDSQASGAYIFRPNSSTVFFPGPKVVPTLHVVKGPVVTEVHQTFS